MINGREEKAITGFCDVCGKQETDTRESLQAEGWYLGRREEFCPGCNQ